MKEVLFASLSRTEVAWFCNANCEKGFDKQKLVYIDCLIAK